MTEEQRIAKRNAARLWYAKNRERVRAKERKRENGPAFAHRRRVRMLNHRKKIGHINKGAFHAWLGKSQDEPITHADIEKGLAAGGHPAKMANCARNFAK
jgi:hypothetical protein